MPAALELLNDPAQSGTNVAQWAKYKWSMEWQETHLDSIRLLKMLAQCYWELAFPDLHELGLTAYKPALIYATQKHTNGISGL